MDTTNEITPEDSFVPVYLVPMTEEEIAASEYSTKLLLDQENRIAEEEAARQSAILKLSKLGLTVEELNAIIA